MNYVTAAMDFLDVEVSSSQHGSVLVPSSQQDLESSEPPRASKRRRLNSSPVSSDGDTATQTDEYDLPSNEIEQEDEYDQPRSKYANYMHVPAQVESQQDQFLTQPDDPWSSPSAMRGPQWRKKSPSPRPKPQDPVETLRPAAVTKPVIINMAKPPPIIVDEFDDEDDELLEAMMVQHEHGQPNAAQKSIQSVARPQRQSMPPPQPPSKSLRQTTLFGMSTTQKSPSRATQSRTSNWPMASRNEPPTHHKIDREAMRSWIYPLNVGAIRDYQFNIVHRALFHNILVALPTGLGKTFIAATVMLNYFRWTEEAQIVFVAPTKPLVTQQVDACFHIAGIPRSQTTLLTGGISPGIRAEQWQEKRVFFMTPQTLINDLKTGMADPKKIVLLVVDEAHKATGNYAYVEVVRFLRRFNSSFRVLALTATPGATVEAVQKVIDGLDIARVEIRTEESLDIRSFVHSRNTEIRLFDNSEEIDLCLDWFADSVRPVLNKVNSLNAYFSNDPKTLTLYGLLKGREQWAKSDAGRKADWGLKGMVNACFKPLMTLAHNLELLKFHGIGPFYHKMKIFEEESSGGGKYTKQIVESDSFRKLMNHLRTWMNKEDFVGHPKMAYLNEVVLNHFMDAGNGAGAAGGRPPSNTRIMIFAHYRDSAEELVRVLNRHEPMIRAHVFVGQSGTKGSEGMDQKTQMDIIQKFKSGTYNTLVATSIGEEGLDIGEVDLIVCYDCSKSPIRMLQRMGRTGRKRSGNIVLLLMRGKEERDYHSAKENYLKMQEIIEDGSHFQFHEDQSPRIVPRELQPVVDKCIVDIPIENTQPGSAEPSKRKGRAPKKPPKKFHMPDGVETGFMFLGAGGNRKRGKQAPTPEPLVDEDFAGLPPLSDVILSAREEDELERRFAQVAGNETVYVRSVRFDAHPERIQRFSKVVTVRHSAITKSLVKASKSMRDEVRNWDRPEEMVVCSPISDPKKHRRASHGGRNRSERYKIDRPPKHFSTSAKAQRDRQNQYCGSGDHDEALDNPPSPSDRVAPRQSVRGNHATLTGKITHRNTKFLDDSRAARGDIESNDEDLPELSTMFDAKQSRIRLANLNTTSAPRRSTNAQRATARRILSDDSDE